jgi:nitroimidazol reductase NimA-like FMN-containing flavoprotein (pyridoxamine 5'-phosphate oxidase superfamily)
MRELDGDEIDEVLVRNGIGVLSLIDGDRPYGVPMSFGYSGETLTIAMQFGTGYGGRKMSAVRSSPRACLTVYGRETDSPPRWRSVIVSGELREATDDETEQALASLTANAEFASETTVWGIPIEEVKFRLFVLDIEERTGRVFAAV